MEEKGEMKENGGWREVGGCGQRMLISLEAGKLRKRRPCQRERKDLVRTPREGVKDQD